MDQLGRVFLAVPVPVEIKHALAAVVSGIQIPGRLVSPDNWHITLRFLDVVDVVTYERFVSEIDTPAETAFRLSLDGFGAFPNTRKATVFWAGVGQGSEQLAVLNEQAEEAAVSAGVMPEERPFHPHLTLSRVRPPVDVQSVVGEELSLSWRCEQLVVYRSHLTRGGARYEPIDSVDLIG